jgi:ABC-2 type transport system ATP-binding protein
MDILQVEKLKKQYGKLVAVNEVSFTVKKGSVFGLLGPNGSGKTTMLCCIMGILNADSGQYSWLNGTDETEARKKIGALIETPNFYPYLSAEKNLEIVALIKQQGKDRIDAVLKEVGLYERRSSSFKTFSLGMKQRLAIASALLTNPEILVLDEPTNGLDPQGINEIRQIILQQSKAGKTIILASHLLNEVEKVCTDVVILKKGNVLASGTVSSLLQQTNQIEIAANNNDALLLALQTIPNVISASFNKQQRITVELEKGYSPAELNAVLFSKSISISHLQQVNTDLESEFLKLVNQ